MIALISLGVSFAHACLMSAATPANCGAAAEVPLNAAHPSLFAVSSPFGKTPPAFDTSISSPGSRGSMM